MSDNVPVVPGTGATSSVSTLDLSDTVFAVATGQVQRMAQMYRAGATAMEVSGSAPLPIAIASGGAPATVTLTNPAAAPLATVTLTNPAAAPVATVSVAGGSVSALISGTVSLGGGATVAAVPPQLPLTATYTAGVGPATVAASGLLKGLSVYANATDVWWRIGASGVAAGATAPVRNGALAAFNPAGSYVNAMVTVSANADYIIEYQSA